MLHFLDLKIGMLQPLRHQSMHREITMPHVKPAYQISISYMQKNVTLEVFGIPG